MKGYVDDGYSGNVKSRKSFKKIVFMLFGMTICWKVNQPFQVSLSMIKARYFTPFEWVKEEILLIGMIEELEISQELVKKHYDFLSKIHLDNIEYVMKGRSTSTFFSLHSRHDRIKGECVWKKILWNKNLRVCSSSHYISQGSSTSGLNKLC